MVNSTDEINVDITFSPPKGDDGVVEGATGSQPAKEQEGTENRTDYDQNRH